MNTLTLVVLGIIAIGIMVGYVKVFARSVLGLIVSIFALVNVVYFGPILAGDIINHTQIDNIVEEKLSDIIEGDINTKVARDISIAKGIDMESVSAKKISKIAKATYYINPAETARVNILRYVGFPDGITNALIKVVSRYDRTYIDETDFPDYVARFYVERVIKVFSGIFIFVVICIGFQIALVTLERNKESNVILVGYIHKVGGAVLGGFTAMVIVWVMLAALEVIPSNIRTKATDQINNSIILSYIQDNNMVMNFCEKSELSQENVVDVVVDCMN